MSKEVRPYEPDDEREKEREDELEEEDDDGVHGPSEEDLKDEPAAVMYCPACRNEVFFDAERCGVCGHYLTTEEGELTWEPQKPLWARIVAGFFLALVLLAVAGLILMLFHGV